MKCSNCGTEFEGKFCPQCGQPPASTPESITPTVPESKQKKPFYKRKWFIALIIVVALFIIGKVIFNGPAKDTSKYKWESLSLSQALPEPKSNTCTALFDYEDSLMLTVCNTSQKEYSAYVEECTEKYSFTNNKLQTECSYSADNGTYSLSLLYNADEKEMDISLNLLKTELPTEAEETEATEAKKEASKKESAQKETPKATEAPEQEQKSTGLGSDFKAAMDSYEAFIDEYISFMKKYNKSDGTDLTLLADYADYITKLADMEKKFSKWQDDDLNDQELAYYLEVQTRVTKKLADAAIS